MAEPHTLAEGPQCPVPHAPTERIQLGHGSGGKMSAALLRDRFMPHFHNPVLDQLGDAAVLSVQQGDLAMSTDTFVVSPLEFPGGNIGSLAVHGTVNDLAMMGATPKYLSAGFVIEEGLPFDLLDRILAAMAEAARESGVLLVTGDTKVVERGKADGLFLNTTGIGILHPGFRPAPDRAVVGDAILVSGPIGRHGMAIMATREQLDFDADITSDSAALFPLVALLRDAFGDEVHVLRDPDPRRRGECPQRDRRHLAGGRRARRTRDPDPRTGGRRVRDAGPRSALRGERGGAGGDGARRARRSRHWQLLRSHPLGEGAAIIGRVVEAHPGMVIQRSRIGGSRVVDMLPGDQLPRIC